MATIKAIEGRSVHQIQSGQVIVDLISVVKELVENSLDAGATSIEIRFKNQGLDSIEVQDNGKGIAPEDFETIALKHYTSKLSSYEDLTSLDTFGFRGEALSSLCALSMFHIVTARAQDDAVGKKLEFEISGKLKGTSVVAAQRGTTVTVEDLFGNLPVRRKELEKNIKREYGKTLSHLYAYACISVGVRFSVSNQMPKAKKVPVFSTKINGTTKENIANVFGAKTLLALLKLDLHLEMTPSMGPSTQSARNRSTQALDRSMEVRVEGHISKPVFGEGRQAPDRQMFFVNSRPCKLPQVSKAFNEVYKSFNVSQSAFIFANLIMDTNAYDVNVSPDKREIMLHDQTALLEKLKNSLIELFEKTDHTMPQSQLPNRKLADYKPLTFSAKALQESPKTNGEASGEESESSEDESEQVNSKHRNTASTSTPPSLIQDWAGRDTEMRQENPAPSKRARSIPADQEQSAESIASKTNGSMLPKRRQDEFDSNTGSNTVRNDQDVQHQVADRAAGAVQDPSDFRDVVQDADPMGSPVDDMFSQRPPHLPRRVQDFNALMDGAYTEQQAPAQPEDIEVGVDKAITEKDDEPSIPAIVQSSQKASLGPVQNAFDRMRPKRTPLQTAEITIGDTTTTTVLGSSPPYKKRRIHHPIHSQSIAEFGASPLLARGLRNFAAPGSQLEIDSNNIPVPNQQAPRSSSDESEESTGEAEDDVEKDQNADLEAPKRTSSKLPVSGDAPTSDALDELQPAPADDDEYEDDYVDEAEKKLQEDEKVALLIQEAELAAAQPTEENLRRASQVLKNTGNRKETTLKLAHYVNVSAENIKKQLESQLRGQHLRLSRDKFEDNTIVKDELDDSNAENRLSLTVSKADFEHMIIIGQFNLGFILAVRPAAKPDDEDELFIIDQHAADEKYNYERLQRTVTLQSQRLVAPKALDLTAIEEEVILNNSDALKANGFEIETTSFVTDEETAGRRCRLLTLPMSREKTFELSDLEELLHLLSEAPTGSSEIPRPKKVQSMLAMRACRSSIMVGRTLTVKQMSKVVRHMGEMEKPWNCPHGRPTMRHLAGLGAWSAWKEGDVIDEDGHNIDTSAETDWAGFFDRQK